MAGPAFIYGTRKARANNAVFEATAAATAAQMRATSTGLPQYIVWYASDSGSGFVTVQRPGAAPAWDGLAVSDDGWALAQQVAGASGRIFDVTEYELGVNFIPLNPPPVPSAVGGLPAPFSGITTVPAGAGKLTAACSFCVAAGGGEVGAIRFNPDGTAVIASQVSPTGGTIALGTQQAENTGTTANVIAFSTPSGMTRVFK